jgi:site-specific recombinase XerC
MHRLDPGVPILPIGNGVARAARQHHRPAHLYTDEEVQRIPQAALAYPSPKAPWRPIWLFTMLMLAYCAGLRGGEIARLKLGDVDVREGTIDIQRAKFFKHRSLPLPFGQKTHLTAFSCGLLMIIAQEPAQSLAALDAPLSIEVTVPRKYQDVVLSLVVALLMVVVNVFTQGPP